MLGADSELDPDYGLAFDAIKQLRSDMASVAVILGNAEAAKSLGIETRRLQAMMAGNGTFDDATLRRLFARLPAAQAKSELMCTEKRRELQRLNHLVQKLGLREAARQLGIDASNLRRKLKARYP